MSTAAATRPSVPSEPRGAKGLERRTQILTAADSHFRQFGFADTTLAELAKSIDVSTAYIHKLFGSKQGLAEAVCERELGRIADELREIAGNSAIAAATRLRLIFQAVARRGSELFFNNQKLHELAVTACVEKWSAVQQHQAELLVVVRELIAEGRNSGEFERKTPIVEVSLAVHQTLELFSQPIFLRQHFSNAEERARCVADLVLRSLAP
jgi:AcrR family transcriptional regulator